MISDNSNFKIEKTNMRYFNNNIKLTGTINEMVKFLNMGIAQNLIQTFFKYNRKHHYCIHCKKTKEEVKQLERAHCNRDDCHRTFLLREAIENIHINDNTPINSKDILKNFIINHKKSPIYYLCNKCHYKYDKS